jgi:hypothetical protein
VEQELVRPLALDERDAARRICEVRLGHPLRIREAVAAALASGGTLADIERARRDIRAHSSRYTLSATLAGSAELPPPDAYGERALRLSSPGPRSSAVTQPAQLREGPALLALLRWAAENKRPQEAIRLGRVIDTAFDTGRRWGAWREVLETVLGLSWKPFLRRATRKVPHEFMSHIGCTACVAGVDECGSEILQLEMPLRPGFPPASNVLGPMNAQGYGSVFTPRGSQSAWRLVPAGERMPMR